MTRIIGEIDNTRKRPMRRIIDLTRHVITFPSGEEQVRIADVDGIDVVLKYGSSKIDVTRIALAADAARRHGANSVSLIMPYCPCARQDRVAVEGDALAIRAFANLLNSIELDQVVIADPHSDVTPALIDRCDVVHQWDIARRIGITSQQMCVVAPDAGSTKKARKVADLLCRPLVQAEKIRDERTGNLTGFTLLRGSVSGQHCLIVDDICDAGGTFLGLGSVLRERGALSLGLYVTHGLFTKGREILEGVFDRIYTSNSVPQTTDLDVLDIDTLLESKLRQ